MRIPQPDIISTKYYTLVSGESGHGKTTWCKREIAKILRSTKERILVFDATGEYADFVINHDRAVPGCVPMEIRQYKSTGGEATLYHTISVDVKPNEVPQLVVYDVSRALAISWNMGIETITDILTRHLVVNEPNTLWLFLCLEPYTYAKPEGKSWDVLERFIKKNHKFVAPVFTSQKFDVNTINERLHVKKSNLKK